MTDDSLQSFVNVKPVIVADAPDAHQVWLDVGCQHFTIGEYCETKDEAEWLANQLRTGLGNMQAALSAQEGEAVYQRYVNESWVDISKDEYEHWNKKFNCRVTYTNPNNRKE